MQLWNEKCLLLYIHLQGQSEVVCFYLVQLTETFQGMPQGYVNSSAHNILRRDLNRLAIPHNIESVHYINDMLNVSDEQDVSST